MSEPEETSRKGWNHVLPVIDVSHGGVRIDVVGEGRVPDARHAVAYHFEDSSGGEVEGEVHGIQQGDSCAWRDGEG
jgi:hypothetical protein